MLMMTTMKLAYDWHESEMGTLFDNGGNDDDDDDDFDDDERGFELT